MLTLKKHVHKEYLKLGPFFDFFFLISQYKQNSVMSRVQPTENGALQEVFNMDMCLTIL